MKIQIFNANALEVLKSLPENFVDSLVTDPPAGIGLMGLDWDKNKGGRDKWIEWLSNIMTECCRVLKPGAHGFVWALPRTSHWTGTALEKAGFQVKDVVTHIFGSGFPKNVAIDKALDRAKFTDTDLIYKVTAWISQRRNELGLTNREIDEIAGVSGGASHWTAGPGNGQPHIPSKERWEKLEPFFGPPPDWMVPLIRPAHLIGDSWQKRQVVGSFNRDAGGFAGVSFKSQNRNMTEATNEHSKKWIGWGTALKPASEHWILIQKPIVCHNIASNIKKYGVGGINIDGCRVPLNGDKIPSTTNLKFSATEALWDFKKRSEQSLYTQHPKGRFPSNIVLSPSLNESCPIPKLNSQAGRQDVDVSNYFRKFRVDDSSVDPFFYCIKPGNRERGHENRHPTVKPIDLMQHLIKMVNPPKGIVLDPFMGSGSTGVAALLEGAHFIGIENNQEYFEIANIRTKGVSHE